MEDLKDAIAHAIESARLSRDDAGRSETGRYLSLCVTALEEADSWVLKAEGVNKPRDGGYPNDEEIDEALERGKRLAKGESPE